MARSLPPCGIWHGCGDGTRTAADGEAEKREEVILSLGPQVHLLAGMRMRRLPAGRVSYEDLVSSGWLGAIRAVDRFDPERSCTLETYADRRIRGSMNDYLRSLDRLTRNQRRKVRRGEERSIRVVALEEMREPADPRLDPARGPALCRLDLELLFRRAGLPPRIRRVMEQRAAGETNAEIAQQEGVSESRISQLYANGMRRMAAAAGGAAT
ncbi:MAG TPA: sigma-70 family RNA polymerase sigma factor [Bryobacteraceae bacterium]